MIPKSNQDYVILAFRFKKQELIAQGSYGVVYKGLMQRNKEIAIKEFHNQELSEVAKYDLEQELAIFKKMKHSNIVSLYGYCPQPLCLVMEFLPMNLFQLIHSEEELSWHLRYSISLGITLGLDYMHEKNIIHRDLKSSNILLDKDLNAKITDFGLSRTKIESRAIKSKNLVGNFRWMAPELMKKKPE